MMADWTTLPNTAVGVGGLPSGTTVTALRDNPIAIAEGAPGAPRVASKALGGVILPVFSQTLANWAGLVNLADFRELAIYAKGGGTTGGFAADVLQIRFSTDNGATWGTAQSLLSIAASSTYNDYFILRIDISTGASTRFFGSSVSSGTITIPSGTVNGVQLRGTGSSALGIAGTVIVTGGR
jgi:hypothetical protein